MRGDQNPGKLKGMGPPVDVLIKKSPSPEYCNKRCSTTRNMKNLKNIKRTGRGSKSGKNWVMVPSSKVFSSLKNLQNIAIKNENKYLKVFFVNLIHWPMFLSVDYNILCKPGVPNTETFLT